MATNHPGGRRAGAASSAVSRGIDWLTTRLLVAYLAVAAAQWLWTVLNTDVRHLLR
jgi:hypothetical protein